MILIEYSDSKESYKQRVDVYNLMDCLEKHCKKLVTINNIEIDNHKLDVGKLLKSLKF